MRINSFKIVIVATTMLVVFFSVMLNSCKKVENNSVATITSKEQLLAALKDSLAIHPDRARIIIPINQIIPGTWYDKSGIPVTTAFRPANVNAVYECNDDADLTYLPTATLISFAVDYNCSQGYQITVTWNISMSMNPVTTSTFSPYTGNTTSGRIRFQNASTGVISNTNTAVTPVAFTYLHDDPTTGNSNKIWQFVYTTPWLPSSYFVSGQGFQAGILAYTDCDQYTRFVSAYSTTIFSFSSTDPCNRIDPVFVSSGTPGQLLGFGNYIFLGGCPTPPGGTYPDRQEVKLAYAGSTLGSLTPLTGALNWHDIYFENTTTGVPGYNSGNTSTQQGTIGLYDSYQIPNWDLFDATVPSPRTSTASPLHGYYYVSFRNWITTGCRGQWSDPNVYSF